jgi:hypothetical protein
MSTFTFTVTRALNGNTGTTTVDWAVTGTGGNPAVASDFVGGVFPSGILTFNGNETTQVITVQVAPDSTIEPDKDFIVTLSNAVNAVITVATAQSTILDDDSGSGPPPPPGLWWIIDTYGGNTAIKEGTFGGTWVDRPTPSYFVPKGGYYAGNYSPISIAVQGSMVTLSGYYTDSNNRAHAISSLDGGQTWHRVYGDTSATVEGDSLSGMTDQPLGGITYYNGKFIYRQQNGSYFLTSPNGLDAWTKDHAFTGAAERAGNSNGNFCAFGGYLYNTGISTDHRGLAVARSSTGTPGSWAQVRSGAQDDAYFTALGGTAHAYNGYLITDGTTLYLMDSKGRVSTSTDGTTWTDLTDTYISTNYGAAINNGSVGKIAYGNGYFVIIVVAALGGRIFVTQDFVTFTSYYMPINVVGFGSFNDVVFHAGHFILVGDSGAIYSTQDPTAAAYWTWWDLGYTSDNYPNGIVLAPTQPTETLYLFNNYLRKAGVDTPPYNLIAFTQDLVSWGYVKPPTSSDYYVQKWTDPQGLPGDYSTDAHGNSNWDWLVISADGRLMMALQEDNYGINQIQNFTAQGNPILDGQGNPTYTYVNYNHVFLSKDGGYNWKQHPIVINQSTDPVQCGETTVSGFYPLKDVSPTSAVYGNGLFIIGERSGSIITSPDGITWTERHTYTPCEPGLHPITAIAFNGNQTFVAVVEDSATLIVSTDGGITWTRYTVTIPGHIVTSWEYVQYVNGRFIAFGSNNTVAIENPEQITTATSLDGLNWTFGTPVVGATDVTPDSGATLKSQVGYVGGTYLTIFRLSPGATRHLYTSPDALVWTQVTGHNLWGGAVGRLMSVTTFQGKFVLVDKDATTITSLPAEAYYVLTSLDGITWAGVPGPFDDAAVGNYAYQPSRGSMVYSY